MKPGPSKLTVGEETKSPAILSPSDIEGGSVLFRNVGTHPRDYRFSTQRPEYDSPFDGFYLKKSIKMTKSQECSCLLLPPAATVHGVVQYRSVTRDVIYRVHNTPRRLAIQGETKSTHKFSIGRFIVEISRKCYTTCPVRLLVFERHVAVKWGNIFGSVICHDGTWRVGRCAQGT
jgi:hypothetical protein